MVRAPGNIEESKTEHAFGEVVSSIAGVVAGASLDFRRAGIGGRGSTQL